MLELVGAKVKCDRGGTEPAGEYTFFYGKGNENHKLLQAILYISPVTRVVSNMM
jgi:hypothetical protein